MKILSLILIPTLIAVSPILQARISSYFCKKCNDSNWMSEGGTCGHGGAIWLMFGSIPMGLSILALMLWIYGIVPGWLILSLFVMALLPSPINIYNILLEKYKRR